jgi:hypothetical protein
MVDSVRNCDSYTNQTKSLQMETKQPMLYCTIADSTQPNVVQSNEPKLSLAPPYKPIFSESCNVSKIPISFTVKVVAVETSSFHLCYNFETTAPADFIITKLNNSMALVGEVSANLYGYRGVTTLARRIPTAVFSVF